MNVLRSSTLLRSLGAAAIFALVGFLAVYSVDEYQAGTVAKLGLYICVALGLTILVGGNGQISLGHAALMAIGAYTMAKFLPGKADDLGQVSIATIILGLLLAVVLTTAVGAVIGVAAARLRPGTAVS